VKHFCNSYLAGNGVLNVFISIFLLQVVVAVSIAVLYILDYKFIDLFQAWLVIVFGAFDDKQIYIMMCKFWQPVPWHGLLSIDL
jgi:hypothetical protein